MRNLLEHGNIEGRVQQREGSEEQQQEVKPFPGPEDQGEEVERTFPIPAEVRRIIHQVIYRQVLLNFSNLNFSKLILQNRCSVKFINFLRHR